MRVTIDDELFENFKDDFNDILNNLLLEMYKVNESTGTISISMKCVLTPAQYTDPDTGEFKNVRIPDFGHKIKSTIKKGEETKGQSVGLKEIELTKEGIRIGRLNNGQQNMFEEE